MEELKARLTGVAPICFHNERLANPIDIGTRELKKLTHKKGKTEDNHEEIKWLEWRLGFYEADGRAVVPDDNVLKMVIEGARKTKKGKQVESGVIAREPFFALSYDGPKTIDALRGDMRFCYYRTVVVSRARCMRARPIFRQWQLPIALMFDPDIIEREELQQAIVAAGDVVGIGERRPRFGRFTAEFL